MKQGLRKQGGQLPPTFAKNRAKLVKNRQISTEIWLLPPHFSVASEGPEYYMCTRNISIPGIEKRWKILPVSDLMYLFNQSNAVASLVIKLLLVFSDNRNISSAIFCV